MIKYSRSNYLPFPSKFNDNLTRLNLQILHNSSDPPKLLTIMLK